MRTIYKYEVPLVDTYELETFKWCRVLSAQMQNGVICLWISVDTEQPKQIITVKIFGTGEEFTHSFEFGPDYYKFIDTVQRGVFVWHIFAAGSFTEF